MADYFIGGLWDLLRGGANVTQPARTDLEPPLRGAAGRQPRPAWIPRAAGRRARPRRAARRRLRAAGHGTRAGRSFCAGRPSGPDRRSSEAIDLAGAARDVVLDAVAGALSIPAATDRRSSALPPRATGAVRRTGSPIGRAACFGCSRRRPAAGARQVIIVAAAADQGRPHGLATRRVHPRARLGEYLASEEAAAIRDALPIAEGWFDAIFVVRPGAQPSRRAGRRRRVRCAVGSLAIGGRAGGSGIRGRLPPVRRPHRRRQRRRDGAQRHAHERGMTASFSRSRGVFFSGLADSCRNWSASSSMRLVTAGGSIGPNFAS